MDKQKQSRGFVWVEVEDKCRFIHALPEKSAEVLVSHEECKVSLQLIISVNKYAPNAEKKILKLLLLWCLMLQFILGFLTGSEMISLFRDGLDTEREICQTNDAEHRGDQRQSA